MPIRAGSGNAITRAYVGPTELDRIYVGETLVFQKAPPPPVFVAPTLWGLDATATHALSWSDIPAAAGFVVEDVIYNPGRQPQVHTGYTSNPFTSYHHLRPRVRYTFRVAATSASSLASVNASNRGAWSSILEFPATRVPPGTSLTGRSGPTLYASSARPGPFPTGSVWWSAIAGADAYQLQHYNPGVPGWLYETPSGGSSSAAVQIEVLGRNKLVTTPPLRWRVRGYNTATRTTSNWSSEVRL